MFLVGAVNKVHTAPWPHCPNRSVAGINCTLSQRLSHSFFSQCSTLVRNTVVRATFKVNGKTPDFGEP